MPVKQQEEGVAVKMNTREEIVWAEKDLDADPCNRVTRVGGRFSSFSVRTVIGYIETGSGQFFVTSNGRELNLEVAIGPDGRKFLKTSADRSFPNSLLLLPGMWEYHKTHPGTPWNPGRATENDR